MSKLFKTIRPLSILTSQTGLKTSTDARSTFEFYKHFKPLYDERKSRMYKFQSIRMRSRSFLLGALGKEGDGILSAFIRDKHNGDLKKIMSLLRDL